MLENPEFMAYHDVVAASVMSIIGPAMTSDLAEKGYRLRWLLYYAKRKFDLGWDTDRTAKEWCGLHYRATPVTVPTLDKLLSYQSEARKAYKQSESRALVSYSPATIAPSKKAIAKALWKRLPVLA